MVPDSQVSRLIRRVIPARARRVLVHGGRTAARLPGHIGLLALRQIYGERLAPPVAVFVLRRTLSGYDPLMPPVATFVGSGSDLANPFLCHVLQNLNLGTWSLSPGAINYLETQVRALQPGRVLEFGSGISTLCLARFMCELHGPDGGPYVFSIDQDTRFVTDTYDRLRIAGLERYVRLVEAPLLRQVLAGRPTTCYSISDDLMRDLLGPVRPDLVLIDGPAAEEGRFGTLPLVVDWLAASARFYLDDALRDQELNDAHIWRGLPGFHLHGYWLAGKGMLVGQVAQARKVEWQRE